MIKIYFKEAKEKYDSVFDVIEHYFNTTTDDGLRNPATYWEDSNELQCKAHKNRSFDDLFLLCQHYIPGAKIEDVVNSVYQFNKKMGDTGLLACIHCSTVQRFVICSSRYTKSTIESANYIYDLFPPSEYSKENGNGKESQWTLNELKSMIVA